MRPLPHDATDDQLLAFADGWVALLEHQNFFAAFAFTDHTDPTGWTPDSIREVIAAYGSEGASNVVTLAGVPTDVTQRKEVTRWEADASGRIGYIWYDLNINGLASDLTATFDLVRRDDGIHVLLSDIHVM
jgi:hypothetical protein